MTQNEADMNSFYQVVSQQSAAYAMLKNTLQMSNEEFLQYMRSQAINEYNQANLVISIPTRA